MKNIGRLTGSLAAVLGGIAVALAPIAVAPVAHADAADDGYMQALKDKGITWPNGSDSTVISMGHATCSDWAKGFTFEQAFADAKSALPNLSDGSLATVLGAATGAYCPQYQSKFN